MAKDDWLDVVDALSEWLDAVLALGGASVSASQRGAAGELAFRLEHAGFARCAAALRAFLESGPEQAPERFGRLCVLLEMTRESLEIERLRAEPSS